MYVTSANGLQIYDVSQPETPRPLSQLALPHLENEGVDVGRDTVVITNDPAFSGVGAIYLIDVSDPANPVLRSTLPTKRPDRRREQLRQRQHRQLHPYLYTTGAAHWFDENGGLLAQGWYDQGVRFLEISDPRDIEQVGDYATTGSFWVAYFAPADASGQTVYGLDTTAGVDVLHIDRSASRPQARPVTTADLLTGKRFGTPSSRWGFACPLPRAF